MKYCLKTLGIFLGIIAFIFLSPACNRPVYPYEEGLIKYMQDVHKLDLEQIDELVIYLFPVDGCGPCVEMHETSFRDIKADISRFCLVLIGENADFDIHENHLQVLYDEAKASTAYRMGLGKPLLVHWKNNKVVYVLKVSDFEIEHAMNYIEKKASTSS